MKSTPTARLGISSCCIPATASRVRPIFVLGSTMLPAGARMPVLRSNRELLAVGVPINSLTCTNPSWFASVQHGAFAVVLHAPLDAFGPHVRDASVLRPPSEFARVILVS